MEHTSGKRTTAGSPQFLRSSRSNSFSLAVGNNSSSTQRNVYPRGSWLDLCPPSLADTSPPVSHELQQGQLYFSSPRTNVFLLPRLPSALKRSEPSGSNSPRIDAAASRQDDGLTRFQSLGGPQVSDSPPQPFLRVKYGGKLPGADGRRLPAAFSVGYSPSSAHEQQPEGGFCFESALRGACSPTCPVDGVRVSPQAVLPEPRLSSPAAPPAAAAKCPQGCSFAAAVSRSIEDTAQQFVSNLPSPRERSAVSEGKPQQESCRNEGSIWKPAVVRDSATYCVVFKPPFWSCCSCAVEQKCGKKLSASLSIGTSADFQDTNYFSVVLYLQQIFPQQQAPALYCKHVRYGIVYDLDDSWSGFLLVAKTFVAFEAFVEQLEHRQIHLKLECLFSTDPAQIFLHECELRRSDRQTSPPPPEFRMSRAPQHGRTYYFEGERKLKRIADLKRLRGDYGQGINNAVWHHVILSCYLHAAPPAASTASDINKERGLPELAAPFWKTRRLFGPPEGGVNQDTIYRWRSFCHGGYLSFYDIDAKGEAPYTESLTSSLCFGNRRALLDIRPLCIFEAALPTDLKEIITRLRCANDLSSVATPQHQEAALFAYFRSPLSPEAKLKLLAGCLLAFSVGVAINTPWFHRKSAGWGWLHKGIPRLFLEVAQGLGGTATLGAAACKAFLISSDVLARQLREARYFVINVLRGTSADRLIDLSTPT